MDVWVLVQSSAWMYTLLWTCWTCLVVPGCGIWAADAAAGQYMYRPMVRLQQWVSEEEISCIAHAGEAAALVPWHSLAHPWTFSAGVMLWPTPALGVNRCCWRHKPGVARRATGEMHHPCLHEDIMPNYAVIGVLSLLSPHRPSWRSVSLCIKITIRRAWDYFPIDKSAELGSLWTNRAMLQREIWWQISALPWSQSDG